MDEELYLEKLHTYVHCHNDKKVLGRAGMIWGSGYLGTLYFPPQFCCEPKNVLKCLFKKIHVLEDLADSLCVKNYSQNFSRLHFKWQVFQKQKMCFFRENSGICCSLQIPSVWLNGRQLDSHTSSCVQSVVTSEPCNHWKRHTHVQKRRWHRPGVLEPWGHYQGEPAAGSQLQVTAGKRAWNWHQTCPSPPCAAQVPW